MTSGRRLVVEREIRADRRRAVGEQAHGGIFVKRRDDEQRLPGDAERLPAGRHDPQPRAVRQQRVRQVGARVDEVLAVVEDEQGAGIGQAVEQPGPCVAAGDPLRAVRQQARLPQADRAEHRLRHVGGVGDRGELGQPDSRPATLRPASRRCAVPRVAGRVVPRSAATSVASRVLPAPPGPTSVTSRYCSSALPHPGHLVRRGRRSW